MCWIIVCLFVQVYSLEVTRSDGQRFEIYRRYGEFFTFHNTLVQLFPAEAGTYNSKQRVLPILPSSYIRCFLVNSHALMYTIIHMHTGIEDVLINSHLESINKYCRVKKICYLYVYILLLCATCMCADAPHQDEQKCCKVYLCHKLFQSFTKGQRTA